MKENRVSEKRHWDDFWNRAGNTREVYDNDGRVLKHFAGVASLEGMSVLEVGAGTGRDGIMMAGRGAEVVSLDYSLSSLNMIRSQIEGVEGVSLCGGDAFALPFADGTFDLVFHQGLLEHFRNPGEMIDEHRRVLKPGGYILVDVPQKWHYYTPLKHLFIAAGCWFAGWETQFSAAQLESILTDHGFSVVATYGEWLNPPIWFRILRKGLIPLGVKLPMYPRIFSWIGEKLAGPRERFLVTRMGVNCSVVIGTIARKI